MREPYREKEKNVEGAAGAAAEGAGHGASNQVVRETRCESAKRGRLVASEDMAPQKRRALLSDSYHDGEAEKEVVVVVDEDEEEEEVVVVVDEDKEGQVGEDLGSGAQGAGEEVEAVVSLLEEAVSPAPPRALGFLHETPCDAPPAPFRDAFVAGSAGAWTGAQQQQGQQQQGQQQQGQPQTAYMMQGVPVGAGAWAVQTAQGAQWGNGGAQGAQCASACAGVAQSAEQPAPAMWPDGNMLVSGQHQHSLQEQQAQPQSTYKANAGAAIAAAQTAQVDSGGEGACMVHCAGQDGYFLAPQQGSMLGLAAGAPGVLF